MNPLALVFGGALAAGLLMCLSRWLWPDAPSRRERTGTIWLRAELAQAGFSRVSAGRFITFSIAVAAFAGMLAYGFSGIWALALLAVLAGGAVPISVVHRRAAIRRRALSGAWPDAIDHLVGAIRAGLGLPDALCALGKHGPEALQSAFLAFERDFRRSGSWPTALDALKQRLADPTADRLCELLRIAREVGGTDLVAVLRAFGAYLREDAAMMAELQARQSWVTNAARLGVVAPWIVLFLLSLRPEARAAYNSAGGIVLIVTGFVGSVVAYQLMRVVGRFRREHRWAT